MVPGNIILQAAQGTALLLDFGLGPLFMPVGSPAYSTDKDLTGIAAFARLLTQRAQETAYPRQL